MIIDRAHVRWGVATLVATIGVTVLYLADNDPGLLPVTIPLPAWLGPVPPLRENVGATRLGLAYGTVALAIFIFAALLGWRRNRSTWKIGRIQTWLKAHIWLTLFTIPLVLLHCGFRGGGPMTQFLLGLYAFVMLSGFWGLALQNIVPAIMRERLPEEVIFEQIPYLRERLIAQAQATLGKLGEPLATSESGRADAGGGTALLAATGTESIAASVRFLEQEALPYLQAADSHHFRLSEQPVSDNLFRALKLQVPESIHPAIDQIQDLCDEKRRLDLQARLHVWLHGWLLVHAPASFLLIVLTIWHAIVATFTYA